MDEGLAAVIAALFGLMAGGFAVGYENARKKDELFYKALDFLGGGSQERNLGIAAIELYGTKKKHHALSVSLLIGSAIYLLKESKQKDAAHELNNLNRMMTFILLYKVRNTPFHIQLRRLQNAILDSKNKQEELIKQKNERNKKEDEEIRGLIVPIEDLDDWNNKINFITILNSDNMKNVDDSKTRYYTWLEFEHQLINNRMTWLLTSQSLLFAAFALASTKTPNQLALNEPVNHLSNLLNTIPVVGTSVSIIILVGIIASYLGKFRARKVYYEETGQMVPVGVNTTITVTAMISEMLLAVVFVIAWIYIFQS